MDCLLGLLQPVADCRRFCGQQH